MAAVRLEAVTKRYGAQPVVEALDLDVRAGEFLTLLGPSGCGKTTTLRMVAGFVQPSSGTIRFDGEDVTALTPRHRQIGMVFQDYALFPHLSVAENIAFGLVERGVERGRIGPRVEELLQLIRLPGLGDRLPAQLSGGQQQRVALARAIAFTPRVLLLDEPLGALDLKMREHMQLEVRRIQQQLGLTALYVTHDQTEAMTMSDRIAVMNRGRIEQLADPETLYGSPTTRFVAQFIGKVNFAAVRLADPATGLLRLPDGAAARSTRVPALPEAARATELTLAIRPEHLRWLAPGAPEEGLNRLDATVRSSLFAGNVRHTTVEVDGGITWLVEGSAGEPAPEPGRRVHIVWHPRHSVLIPEGSPSSPAGAYT